MDNEKNNLLNDEQLEYVSGGASGHNNAIIRKCPKCNETVAFMVYSGGRAICQNCRAQTIL